MPKGFAVALVLALGLAAGSAPSAPNMGAVEVRKQALASMVVTGQVAIDAQGNVTAYELDQVEKLPPGVVGMFANNVPKWRFEPMVGGGVARATRSKLRVRVVARKLDSGDYAVSFQHADFPALEPVPGSFPTSRRMVHPRYPEGALRNGASAAVYVLVKVGPDGSVEDAIAEQVNLPFYAAERVMESYREVFGDAAVRAAKASTFNPPTVGEFVGKSASVRIPYEFWAGSGTDGVIKPYGQWSSYVPGPLHPAPWEVGQLLGAPDLRSADAGAQPLSGPGDLRLLTPLGGEG
jgi:hypothetical protein